MIEAISAPGLLPLSEPHSIHANQGAARSATSVRTASEFRSLLAHCTAAALLHIPAFRPTRAFRSRSGLPRSFYYPYSFRSATVRHRESPSYSEC